MNLVLKDTIRDFFSMLDKAYAHRAQVFLIGETTQVWEGWRQWTTQLEFAAEIPQSQRCAFEEAITAATEQLNIAVIEEHPGDLIPLPDAYRRRAVDTGITYPNGMQMFHFDPYSVAFRFIARGDEPDYHIALMYLQKGWVNETEMEALLANLLPSFSMKTIQQDPAEFRRKYKGLKQMWQALRPGMVHRPTPT